MFTVLSRPSRRQRQPVTAETPTSRVHFENATRPLVGTWGRELQRTPGRGSATSSALKRQTFHQRSSATNQVAVRSPGRQTARSVIGAQPSNGCRQKRNLLADVTCAYATAQGKLFDFLSGRSFRPLPQALTARNSAARPSPAGVRWPGGHRLFRSRRRRLCGPPKPRWS